MICSLSLRPKSLHPIYWFSWSKIDKLYGNSGWAVGDLVWASVFLAHKLSTNYETCVLVFLFSWLIQIIWYPFHHSIINRLQRTSSKAYLLHIVFASILRPIGNGRRFITLKRLLKGGPVRRKTIGLGSYLWGYLNDIHCWKQPSHNRTDFNKSDH